MPGQQLDVERQHAARTASTVKIEITIQGVP